MAPNCPSGTAHRRWASSPTWAICRKPCATIWRASAGATATTRFSPTPRLSNGSTSPTWSRRPARLDWDKLGFINNHYIRAADDARLFELTRLTHEGRGEAVHEAQTPALARAIPLVKDGAKTILDLANLTVFTLKRRPLTPDEKTLGLLTEETRARLGRLRDHLAAEADWSQPVLTEALRAFATAEGVGLGKFGPALRGVLSGGAPAPDLASALSALGLGEALGRIDDALSQLR